MSAVSDNNRHQRIETKGRLEPNPPRPANLQAASFEGLRAKRPFTAGRFLFWVLPRCFPNLDRGNTELVVGEKLVFYR